MINKVEPVNIFDFFSPKAIKLNFGLNFIRDIT